MNKYHDKTTGKFTKKPKTKVGDKYTDLLLFAATTLIIIATFLILSFSI